MAIYRYTNKVKKALQLKAKPEPWLHCYCEMHQEGAYVIVYVWDTRDVVESYFKPFKDYGEYHEVYGNLLGLKLPKAKDNRQPLKGSGRAVDYANNSDFHI